MPMKPAIGEAVERLTARISQLPDGTFEQCWTALGTIVRAVCSSATQQAIADDAYRDAEAHFTREHQLDETGP